MAILSHLELTGFDYAQLKFSLKVSEFTVPCAFTARDQVKREVMFRPITGKRKTDIDSQLTSEII